MKMCIFEQTQTNIRISFVFISNKTKRQKTDKISTYVCNVYPVKLSPLHKQSTKKKDGFLIYEF